MIRHPENPDEQPYEFDEPIIAANLAEAERICKQKVMNATEQIETRRLRVGAKPGQVVLFVDLSTVEQPSDVLRLLTSLGYEPQLRYLELKTGLHVVAMLKDEQHDPTQALDEDYLLDEWEGLTEQINPDAVRLWRGYPQA